VKEPNIFHNYETEKITRKAVITRYNRFWGAGCSRLEYVDIRLVY